MSVGAAGGLDHGDSPGRTITDASRTRIDGTIAVLYDHRPGGCMSRYDSVAILKHFELARTSD
jgi:hypothetical protein